MKHISTGLFMTLAVSLFPACNSSLKLRCDPETVQLQNAVKHGRVDLLPGLIQAGADLNGSCKEHLNTPLTMAAWEKRTTAVKTLLKAGADPNELNYYGLSALMIAAQDGHVPVVQALLADQRLEVNLEKENGATALMLAAQDGHVPVVQALLADQRLEVNLKDDNGWTALMIAAKNGHVPVVQALLTDQRLEVNLKDDNGLTALMIAAVLGHDQVMQALRADQRLVMNSQDGQLLTALMLATKENRPAVVSDLKEGVSTTTRNSAGDITFDDLVINASNILNTSSGAPLPSNKELQQGITQLATEMEKVRQLIAGLQRQGSELGEAVQQELETLNEELRRLEKEKVSLQDLKDLKEEFEGALLIVQGFMQEHGRQLSQISRNAQDKNLADKELASALSGKGAQDYAYNLMLSLNRLYLAAMIGTSGHFTGKGNSLLSTAASVTALLGRFLPTGSNYTDIVAEILKKGDEYLLKKAFKNITELAPGPAEMDQIAYGVMRELSLSNALKLTPSLCNQQLQRIMAAARSGKLKDIDRSGSPEERIRKVVLGLANIAEAKEIGRSRVQAPGEQSSGQFAVGSNTLAPRPRLRSRAVSFLNKSGNLRGLETLMAEQEDENAPAGPSFIKNDLREAFQGVDRDALITPGDLRAKEQGFRKPKGTREEIIARRASGVFRVIDAVIFEDVQLKAMKKASLKLALKAALIDKILRSEPFGEAFLSEDEATQQRVWGMLKEEVEEIASHLTQEPAADIKVLAREAVRRLAEALAA